MTWSEWLDKWELSQVDVVVIFITLTMVVTAVVLLCLITTRKWSYDSTIPVDENSIPMSDPGSSLRVRSAMREGEVFE